MATVLSRAATLRVSVLVVILLAATVLISCGQAQTGSSTAAKSRAYPQQVSSRGLEPDEAREAAADELAGYTYEDLGEPYGCTQDCSGHEAGVAWAQENGIVYPEDCGGRSESFEEGCLAYAEAVEARAAELEAE